MPKKRLLIEGEREPLGSYIFSILLVVGATLMGVLARVALALPDVVMIYILIIMYAAARFGHGPSIAVTGVAVLARPHLLVTEPGVGYRLHDEG